jgi:uncharacterized protein (TIGR03083 family)
MPLPYNASQHILRDGQQLIDAAQRTGLDAPVESCPGWNMRDLAWHIGNVWSFWALVVNKRITTIEELRAEPDPAQPNDDLLLDWVAAAHTGIHSTLNSTPTETEFWTWTGENRDLWWLRRRMAQETAVHRWDAERTVGEVYEIPIALAPSRRSRSGTIGERATSPAVVADRPPLGVSSGRATRRPPTSLAMP